MPITPAPFLQQMLARFYTRSWGWDALPPFGQRSAGATGTLEGGVVFFDTLAGANRIFEVSESVDDDPTEHPSIGEHWWQRDHIVRAIIMRRNNTSPAGESFMGIGLGSPEQLPPWNARLDTFAYVQLRFNFTLDRWEFAIYDGDGTVATVQACTVNFNDFSDPQGKREAMLFYQPSAGRVQCFLDNQLVHTYSGGKVAGIQVNGASKGASYFCTSGSNALGRQIMGVYWNQAITLYTRHHPNFG